MADADLFISVKLEGVDIGGDVVEVDVEDHDQLLDQAQVVIDDRGESTAELPREGQRMVVDIGTQEEHAVLFEGVVSEVRVRSEGRGTQRIELMAYDLGYLLKRRTPSPTNHVGSLSSIIRAVIEADPAVGIQVGQIEPDPDPEFDARRPLRQTQQTDWDFLAELAERYRCRSFVEVNEGVSKYYFMPVSRLLAAEPIGRLSYNGNHGRLIAFELERIASLANRQSTLATVDPASGAVVSRVSAERPAETPTTPSAAASDAGGDQLAQALQLADGAVHQPDGQRPAGRIHGLPSDPDLAEALATSDPTRAHGLLGRGEAVGVVAMRAKSLVDFEGLPAWATGNWYLRQVNHVVARSGAGLDFTNYRCRFEVTR